MKTTFGPGVIVRSDWLNGAKKIFFDGQDLDWHYDPIGLESLILKGANGLDSRYVTLGTDQPVLSTTGIFLSGFPISGDKVVTGKWAFGFDPEVNPEEEQNYQNAPTSYLTNLKYNYANGVPDPSVEQRIAALAPSDIITKTVLVDQVVNFIVDDGTY